MRKILRELFNFEDLKSSKRQGLMKNDTIIVFFVFSPIYADFDTFQSSFCICINCLDVMNSENYFINANSAMKPHILRPNVVPILHNFCFF